MAGILLALISLTILSLRAFWDVEGMMGGGLVLALVIVSTTSSSAYLLYNVGSCKLNRMKLKSMMASKVQQLSNMSPSSKDEKVPEDTLGIVDSSMKNLKEGNAPPPVDLEKREEDL